VEKVYPRFNAAVSARSNSARGTLFQSAYGVFGRHNPDENLPHSQDAELRRDRAGGLIADRGFEIVDAQTLSKLSERFIVAKKISTAAAGEGPALRDAV
jgi:hypothetical protein